MLGARAVDRQGMAIAPAAYTPLRKWTQALTAEERARERRHEAESYFANLDLAS